MRFPFALIATMAVTLGMPGRTAAMALDIGRQRENGPTEWAIPHISAAHVRTEPRHGAEMSTQALMGWPIAVLERLPDGWS